jgi:hypothetical protein
MKIIRPLCVLGLVAAMGLAVLAQGLPGPPGRGGPPGPPGAAGGRGGGPKNVQVLGTAPIPETMQSFVQALGLLDKDTCNYCHVADRSSEFNFDVRTRGFFVPVARVGGSCYLVFGKKLFTDCSLSYV